MNEIAELCSARDTDGHGTHTASIAAGRYVYPASTPGYARGVAAGMAPKACLAVYKVCWATGCFDSNILAAFDATVADGAMASPLALAALSYLTTLTPSPLAPSLRWRLGYSSRKNVEDEDQICSRDEDETSLVVKITEW
ncbi:hypothetical protein KFK09_000676 [Dendrobium nobile]|uniref:Peptidase S8/S53 domain-containing protein n=1 Tax=Dendrobium nobile TaxID=94219 RepID=A0A8T3C969_DENNO|nr:hypothetical protein KFK09_000676 [Dendrobium nobile]